MKIEGARGTLSIWSLKQNRMHSPRILRAEAATKFMQIAI